MIDYGAFAGAAMLALHRARTALDEDNWRKSKMRYPLTAATATFALFAVVAEVAQQQDFQGRS
jgi:hypothetical protein